jgi:hypothetical protein
MLQNTAHVIYFPSRFLLRRIAQNIGRVEIDNLEAAWTRRYDDDNSKNSMDDHDGKEASTGPLPGGPSTMIHMDLFYNDGDHEYGDDIRDASPENGIGRA